MEIASENALRPEEKVLAQYQREKTRNNFDDFHDNLLGNIVASSICVNRSNVNINNSQVNPYIDYQRLNSQGNETSGAYDSIHENAFNPKNT